MLISFTAQAYFLPSKEAKRILAGRMPFSRSDIFLPIHRSILVHVH